MSQDDLPERLEPDCIVEAAFEARFEINPAPASEVLIGRLADTADWRSFKQRRLPTADIPEALRRADPALRFQPAVDLIDPEDQTTKVRIGPQTLIFTKRAPYPGWMTYGGRVARTVDVLFGAFPGVSIVRLGLRYINALRSDAHGISGVQDLNLSVMVDNAPLTESLNLNYQVELENDSKCAVRLATRNLAQGSIPDNTTLLLDLDVFTQDVFRTTEAAAAKHWIDFAHKAEKRVFFRLLTTDTIARLRSDK